MSVRVCVMSLLVLALCALPALGDIPSNGYLWFDGNDLITVPDAASLDTPTLTAEMWVNFDRLAGGPGFEGTDRQFLLCKGGDRTAGAFRIMQGGYDAGQPFLAFDVAEYWLNGQYGVSAFVPLQTAEWYHIAATYDGAQSCLYLNGVLIASNAGGAAPMGNGSPLYMSFDDVAGFEYYLSGGMDEVRLWDVALTAEQILAGYNAAVDPNSPHLLSYWSFDEPDGQIVFDGTGTGNDGILGRTLAVAGDDPRRMGYGPPPPVIPEPLTMLSAIGAIGMLARYTRKRLLAGTTTA